MLGRSANGTLGWCGGGFAPPTHRSVACHARAGEPKGVRRRARALPASGERNPRVATPWHVGRVVELKYTARARYQGGDGRRCGEGGGGMAPAGGGVLSGGGGGGTGGGVPRRGRWACWRRGERGVGWGGGRQC